MSDFIHIIDLRGKLATHPTRKWEHRHPLDIAFITVHHQAGTGKIENVAQYHVGPNHICKKGCPGVCYHYYIDRDGLIYQLNDDSTVVFSCGSVKKYRFPSRMSLKNGQDANKVSIGILLQGDFDGEGHKGFNGDPTEAQLRSLSRLRSHLLDKLNLPPEAFLGHCHVNKRECPGFTVQNFLEFAWDRPAIWFVPEPEDLIKHIQERFKNIILAPIRQ